MWIQSRAMGTIYYLDSICGYQVSYFVERHAMTKGDQDTFIGTTNVEWLWSGPEQVNTLFSILFATAHQICLTVLPVCISKVFTPHYLVCLPCHFHSFHSSHDGTPFYFLNSPSSLPVRALALALTRLKPPSTPYLHQPRTFIAQFLSSRASRSSVTLHIEVFHSHPI